MKLTSHLHLNLTTGFLHSDSLNKTLYAFLISPCPSHLTILQFPASITTLARFLRFSGARILGCWVQTARHSHGFCGLLAPGYWDLGFEKHEENENMSEFFPPCDCVVRDLATG
jgi:hypothetical protein